MRRHPFFAAVFAVLLGSAAQAGDYKIGSLDIVSPWSRATPKGASVGVGFLKIINNGGAPDRLIGGASDASEAFEVHEMAMRNDVMTMRPVKGGLEIRPGETVEFKSGSVHIMFVDLKKPLVKGDRITAMLQFEQAGKVEVAFEVLGIGARGSDGMSTGNNGR